jgi:hypothetical protein
MLRIAAAHIHIYTVLHAHSYPIRQPYHVILRDGLELAIISATCAVWPVGSVSASVMRL